MLDDLDITLSLDSRQAAADKMTSIELGMTPVTLRASITDINLIMSIVTRAIALLGEQTASPPSPETTDVSRPAPVTNSRPSYSSRSGQSSSGLPQVHLSKEKVICSSYDLLIFLIADCAHSLAQGSLRRLAVGAHRKPIPASNPALECRCIRSKR